MIDGVRNYSDIYCKVLSWYSNPVALSCREEGDWNQISTQEFLESVKFLSLGLRKLGLGRGDTLGLLGNSSLEWISLDFAAILAGGITVPFFSNISQNNFQYQVEHAQVKLFFISGDQEWEMIKNHTQNLKAVISKKRGENSDLRSELVTDYLELIKIGKEYHNQNPREFPRMLQECRADDLATIIYTSGSTGVPKGVELSQIALVNNVKSAKALLPPELGVEKALSCLPIAHIYERTMTLFYLCSNISLYIVDDIQNTGELAREIKPCMITVVPRLLEKIYSKIYSKLQSATGVKRVLGRLAMNLAKGKFPVLQAFLMPTIDRLVYARFREALGGKVKLMFSGGAPLNPELSQFFPAVGIPVVQGYGMTECPFISTNLPWSNKVGTVGKPFPRVEVTLGGDQEILVRGHGVMRGYHRLAKENKRVLEDGWLHTGDRGTWHEDGFLEISGRMKELLKTSNGKYVSPLPMEQQLCQSPLVETAMVVADGLKFPACLIFLNEEELKRRGYVQQAKNDMEQEHLLKTVGSELGVLVECVNQNLNGWERLRKFRMIPRAPSIEAGELTPTLKLRRFAVVEKYQDLIHSMYADPASPKTSSLAKATATEGVHPIKGNHCAKLAYVG
jgi:long-chain acyl-CoA synthetase